MLKKNGGPLAVMYTDLNVIPGKGEDEKSELVLGVMVGQRQVHGAVEMTLERRNGYLPDSLFPGLCQSLR